MNKRTLGRILAVLLCAVMIPTNCFTANPRADDPEKTEVEYVYHNQDGITYSSFEMGYSFRDMLEKRDDNAYYLIGYGESWETKYYLVDDSIVLDETLVIDGLCGLVLGDGYTLQANGGIKILPDASLTIYAQAGQTGTLIANPERGPGIGNIDGLAGELTIDGGQITANGKYHCAGIGGGAEAQGSTIGFKSITIYGGVINANGGEGAAGIGNGYGNTYNGNGISILGVANVTATGGTGAAGIGSGANGGGMNASIIIDGQAVVKATGGYGAAGIGGAVDSTDSNIAIVINNGNVTAVGTGGGAGIGGAVNQPGKPVYMYGGTITSYVVDGNGAYAIGAGANGLYEQSSSYYQFPYMSVQIKDANDQLVYVRKAQRKDALSESYVKVSACTHHMICELSDEDEHINYCEYCEDRYNYNWEAHDFTNGACVCGYVQGATCYTFTFALEYQPTITVFEGQEVILPEPVYVASGLFRGWETPTGDVLQPGDSVVVTGNMDFTAKIAQRLDVSIKSITDEVMGSYTDYSTTTEEIGSDNIFTLPECGIPAPAGKKFTGWTVNGTVVSDTCPLLAVGTEYQCNSSSITLFAHWEDNPDPEFTDYTIQLSSKVDLTFFLTLKTGKTIDDYAGSYVTFSGNKINSNKKYYLNEATTTDNTSYAFTINLSSIQMADQITPTFHFKDGSVWKTSVGTAHSVQDYISWAISSGAVSGNDVTILKALADYGYHAQKYLSAQNGWTFGEDYAPMNLYYDSESYSQSTMNSICAAVASEAPVVSSSDVVKTVQHRVRFGSTLTLQVYFELENGFTEDNITVQVNGSPATIKPYNNGAGYLVAIPDIYANQLTDDYVVTISGAGSSAPCTITISVMSYVYSSLKEGSSASAGCKQLVCALYYFAQACE